MKKSAIKLLIGAFLMLSHFFMNNNMILAQDCGDIGAVSTVNENYVIPPGWGMQCECSGKSPIIMLSDNYVDTNGYIEIWIYPSSSSCPPFSWEVIDEGFYFDEINGPKTAKTFNYMEKIKLWADHDACNATIKVVDICGAEETANAQKWCDATGAVPFIDLNSDTIYRYSFRLVKVDSDGLACPPYDWMVFGEGFHFNSLEGPAFARTYEDLETIEIWADNSACSAIIQVWDCSGATDKAYLRYVGGYWWPCDSKYQFCFPFNEEPQFFYEGPHRVGINCCGSEDAGWEEVSGTCDGILHTKDTGDCVGSYDSRIYDFKIYKWYCD